jgi:protein-S-isoprenylcysteine O-methyltransferase Ste14
MWFKLIFLSAFAFATAIAAATARRSRRRHGGSLNHLSHEVRALLFVRGALGLVFYSALIAWMLFPGSMAWSYLPLPIEARWLGAALLAPALAFFAWSFHSLGENYRGGVGLYEAHQLVTTGPYRWMRHPIYLAFSCIMLLLLPLSGNWVLGLSGLALVMSIAVVRIPIEERQLDERFGPAWKRYRDNTGLFLPWIR